MFDSIIFGGIALIGIIYWLWSINKDLKQYKLTKNSEFLIGTILGIVFIGLILVMNWKNNSDLYKPTLVRVYYDGDFNGTSIDFKTDGTYVFDNHAIGFSDYTYGKYQINGQMITLDKKEIDNVIESDLLEIKKKKINGTDNSENYLFQIGNNGTEIKRATEFRVVVDNRK
ncbi:hypothetical protein [uncultured Algibacter sp.]|uniref:hypothetical protein n=1 Tax=uncultured Algibacter sp. TaxID=298659 RepID=UPI002610D6E0|nr:hypothetical protein [uncultured Algibacter sp.]